MRIEVHDTGSGIPDSKRKLIFREFERLGHDAASAPGLGLGLSIVDRIARMLKHPVGLRSTLGKGSVFTITLAGPGGARRSIARTSVRKLAGRKHALPASTYL